MSNPSTPTTNQDTTSQASIPSQWLRLDLEAFAKSAAFFALACYTVGFLTVNIYLFGLGLSDFSPLNPRFVITGALALLFLVFNIICPIIGIWTLIYGKKEISDKYLIWRYKILRNMSKSGKILSNWISRYLGGLLFISIPTIISTIIINRSSQGNTFTILPYILFSVISILSLSVSIFYRDPEDRRQEKSLMYRLGEQLSSWFFLVLSCIAYLILFTWFIYPVLPEQFGGGQPKQARLLIAADAVDGVRELGISIPVGTQLTDSITVLFEGSDSFIVRLPNNQVVRLNKSLIPGVRMGPN